MIIISIITKIFEGPTNIYVVMINNYDGKVRNKYLVWEFPTLQHIFKIIHERVGEWGLVYKKCEPAQIRYIINSILS